MYRNKFDRTGRASEQGANAEREFKASIDTMFGSNIKLTGLDDGQLDHIDFRMNLEMSVDVKSIKDPSTLWIEFKNVRGDDGWLYGSATHFAFEREFDFQIVSKRDLVRLVDQLTDKTTMVDSPRDCMYKMYSRKKYGRYDLLTKIHPNDLNKIQSLIISKRIPEEDDASPWI